MRYALSVILTLLAFQVITVRQVFGADNGGVTCDISDGSPAATPNPAKVNQAVTATFHVDLYSVDSNHQEQPAANVKSQSYTISSTNDSTITSASASGFTSTIAGDKHSVTLTKSGGNADANFDATVVLSFSQTGNKNITMDGTVTFNDNSTVAPLAPHVIPVTISTISIEVVRTPGAGATLDAFSFDFYVDINVEGAGNNLEIRQTINCVRNVKTYAGVALLKAQILALPWYAGADRVAVYSNGTETDTGWDWQALTFVNGVASLRDEQAATFPNDNVTVGGVVYHEGMVGSITRTLVVEVRDKNFPLVVIASHQWSVTFNNNKATWTANPAPPNVSCVRGDISTGTLVVTGVKGIPWW